MAMKVEWYPQDYAAQEVLESIYLDSGLSYRRVEELAEGRIGYNRVRDIRLGERGAIRLSEMLILCDVFKINPLATLQKIIDRAKEIETQETTEPVAADVSQLSEEEKIQLTLEKLKRGDMSIAALHDPNKEIEMNGEAYE